MPGNRMVLLEIMQAPAFN